MGKPETGKFDSVLFFKFYLILPFMIYKETTLFLPFLLDIYSEQLKLT